MRLSVGVIIVVIMKVSRVEAYVIWSFDDAKDESYSSLIQVKNQEIQEERWN